MEIRFGIIQFQFKIIQYCYKTKHFDTTAATKERLFAVNKAIMPTTLEIWIMNKDSVAAKTSIQM